MEWYQITIAIAVPILVTILGQWFHFRLTLKQKRKSFFYKKLIIFSEYANKIQDEYFEIKSKGAVPNDGFFYSRINSMWNKTIIQADLIKEIKLDNPKFVVTKIMRMGKIDNKEIVKQINFIEDFLSSWGKKLSARKKVNTLENIALANMGIDLIFMISKNLKTAEKIT